MSVLSSAPSLDGDVRQLRERRAKVIHEIRAIQDRATKEDREPNAEERRHMDVAWADVDALEKRYVELESASGVEDRRSDLSRLETAEASLRAGQGRVTDPGQPGRGPDAVERRGNFVEVKSETPESRAWDRYLRGDGDRHEFRALQMDSDPAGGYLAVPTVMASTIVKGLDNAVVIRQLATVIPLGEAGSLGVPSLDADPSDATWTSELGTGDEDSSMAFGKRELRPHAVAKRIKVSRQLLQRVRSAAGIVQDRLVYKFAVTEEKAFMTGDGAGKPLGCFVASDDGIPTSRDVSTHNTTSTISADNLISVKYSLKAQYCSSPSLRWVFHRDAVCQIRKLKDGNGQYLWQPSVVAGEPDRILDVPYTMSEYCPNTFTTGQYVGLLGDFRFYWIADGLSMTLQRLDELYAETNQVGFIGRLECDGMPILAEAFSRVKLA